MPKTGIEPISKSYKEFVLPIKLFRLKNKNKTQINNKNKTKQIVCLVVY